MANHPTLPPVTRPHLLPHALTKRSFPTPRPRIDINHSLKFTSCSIEEPPCLTQDFPGACIDSGTESGLPRRAGHVGIPHKVG